MFLLRVLKHHSAQSVARCVWCTWIGLSWYFISGELLKIAPLETGQSGVWSGPIDLKQRIALPLLLQAVGGALVRRPELEVAAKDEGIGHRVGQLEFVTPCLAQIS